MRTALLAAAIALTGTAAAHGALAIGMVDNDKKNAGVSLGWGTEYATPEGAAADALKWCRNSPGMKQEAMDACRLVVSFSGACFATAFNRTPKASGFGWAVGPTKEAASASALASCRDSAGAQADLCTPDLAECDPVVPPPPPPG